MKYFGLSSPVKWISKKEKVLLIVAVLKGPKTSLPKLIKLCGYMSVTQYNKRYSLSTFEKNEIFVLSNRRFNKLSNDIKFVKIDMILLKVQLL